MDEVEKLASASGSDAQMEFAKDESQSLLPGGPPLADFAYSHGAISKLRGRASRDNNKSIVLERAELTDAVRRVFANLRISARTP